MRLGPVDQVQGRVVGFSRSRPPRDKPVVHQHQRGHRWGARKGVTNRARERQAGGNVRDDGRPRSKGRGDHLSAVITIGERQDGARVRVDHKSLGKNGVGQGLDGSSARGWAQGVAGELAGHGLVG